MRVFRPSHLFYFLAVVSSGLLIYGLTQTPSAGNFETDMTPYFGFAVVLTLLSATIYSFMFRRQTPISMTWGTLHFVATVAGLYFSYDVYELICFVTWANSGEFISSSTKIDGSQLLIFFGPSLLLVSLALFIIAINKARHNKKIV